MTVRSAASRTRTSESGPSLSRRRLAGMAVALPALLLPLGACSGPAPTAGNASQVKIVASTGVYADLAKRVGGEHVEVQALIPASQDPHSFEAAAKDKVTVKNADVIVLNGAGYDQFLSDLARDAGKTEAVVDAVSVSGLPGADDAAAHATGDAKGHDHAEFNEHVWYSFPAMKAAVSQIEKKLEVRDPSHAADYKKNAEKLTADLDGLQKRAEGMRAIARGKSAVMTEPVPGYLFETIGLSDATDPKLAAAVEAESDIPPAVFAAAKTQLSRSKVTLLAFNTQTASPQTEQLAEAAKTGGVPVVSLTETMPEGTDYISWMNSNLDSVEKALKGAAQ